MKWGRKKPSSSSSSSSSMPSLISSVLPNSWLSKFKQMGINSEEKHKKAKRKGKSNFVPLSSPHYANGGDGERGKFYGGDGDEFWRLSFEDDRFACKKERDFVRPVWYDIEERLEFPPSSCQSCQSCRSNATKVRRKEGIRVFSNMVYDERKMRELPGEVEFSPCKMGAEIRTPRLKAASDKELKKTNQKVSRRKQLEPNRRALAKDCFEPLTERSIGMMERGDSEWTSSDPRKDCFISSVKSRESYLRMVEEDCVFVAQEGIDLSTAEERLSFEWQKLKEKKIQELKSRSVKQRKSMYITRELQRKKPKQNRKLKIHSPRTSRVEVCKIKAIEDMKKAKLKTKKKLKEEIEGFSGLDSSAVVKFSFDPQQDFRDSMIEMIQANGISRPEELEELLACYLTLNSDMYHDLIMKVFRGVWFEINEVSFDTELEIEQSLQD